MPELGINAPSPDRSRRGPRRGHRLPAGRRGRHDAVVVRCPGRRAQLDRPEPRARLQPPPAGSREPGARGLPRRPAAGRPGTGAADPPVARATASISTRRTSWFGVSWDPDGAASDHRFGPARVPRAGGSASSSATSTSSPPGSPAPTSSSARCPPESGRAAARAGPRRRCARRSTARGCAPSRARRARVGDLRRGRRTTPRPTATCGRRWSRWPTRDRPAGRPARRPGCAARVHVERHSRVGPSPRR